MPKRPAAHIIGDIALGRVAQICSDLGWACESVQKDYGDDLLVQPSYKGMIENNRLWIQVKGTRNIDRFLSKKYGYSMKVSYEQAIRWARSADLAVVVLWDIEKDFGLWTLPGYSIDKWALYGGQIAELWKTDSKKPWKLRLVFEKPSLFNDKQLEKIGWIARIDHYAALIDSALIQDGESFIFEQSSPNNETDEGSRARFIAFDFLVLIDAFTRQGFTDRFLDWWQKGEQLLNRHDPNFPPEKAKKMGAMLAILRQMHELYDGKLGLRLALLEECADLAMDIVDFIPCQNQ